MSKLLSLLRSSFILLCRCFRVLMNNFIMDRFQKCGIFYGKRDDSKINTSDDDIDYDSTWEDEEKVEEKETFSEEKGGVTRSVFTSTRWPGTVRRNIYAAQDMQNFRHRLKACIDEDSSADEDSEQGSDLLNVQFYRNHVPSDPDGVYLQRYHDDWSGDYRKLETEHSYIQWLFPIQEQGMNYYAYPLAPKEIKLFRKDEDLKKRLLVSYKLMLDFYGIKLINEETGKVTRAMNWEDRFANLNRNTHNNLRITRILKCLGILGFKHFQAPLVQFFLEETLVKHTLQRVKASVLDYFMFAVLDSAERKELIKFAFMNYDTNQTFVWCPKRIQRKFLRDKKGSPGNSDSESSPSRECEGPPTQLEVQGTSLSHRVSKTQDLCELQTMTDKTSRKNMAVDNPVPTLTERGVRAPVGFQDLSEKQHIEIACCVTPTEEEVSAPDECDISTPDRAKRDSERTAVSQNSGGDRRVGAVGETNKHLKNMDQTTAEGPTAGDENAELSREHGNMSPVSKNADLCGIDMLTNQPISKNLQDVTNEDSGSAIKADNKSDSGRNEENEQSSEYPDVNQQPGHVLATEKTHLSNPNKDMDDHSKSDSGRNEENEQSSEYPDVNQQPGHVLATEKTHLSNPNEDMDDHSISNSNINNGSNAGGSVLSLCNADSDLVKCEEHEDELKDREDTQHSVNESIRIEVTDDNDDDGGVSAGDRSITAV